MVSIYFQTYVRFGLPDRKPGWIPRERSLVSQTGDRIWGRPSGLPGTQIRICGDGLHVLHGPTLPCRGFMMTQTGPLPCRRSQFRGGDRHIRNANRGGQAPMEVPGGSSLAQSARVGAGSRHHGCSRQETAGAETGVRGGLL